jgi:hypothetical protein
VDSVRDRHCTLYIYYLPPNKSVSQSLSVLFTDDTSIIVTEPDLSCLVELTKKFTVMDKWFIANKFSLNFDESDFIEFVTNNKPITNMHISYNNQYIIIIIIIITGPTTLCGPWPSSKASSILPHFMLLNRFIWLLLFRPHKSLFFLQGGVVSPTPNPQPGGPGLRIYVPWRQGGPAVPPGTGFLF